EQVGERGVVAVVGVAREQQRQPAARALDRDPLEQLHQASASCSASISANASLARRKLSTAAGMPPYMPTCSRTSRISSRVSPLLSAPRMWILSSLWRLSTAIIARLIRLRSRRGSPSRPQFQPQQ